MLYTLRHGLQRKRSTEKISVAEYTLPKGMRFSKLEERAEFYKREFRIKRVERWLGKKLKKTVFAVIIGRHTNIYPERYRGIKNNTVIISDWRDLKNLKEYLTQYLPESVYYDRNVYENLEICRKCESKKIKCWKCRNFAGQELAFDIDPENISCPYHGDWSRKMKSHRGLSFCMYEFNIVKRQTAKLYEELKKTYSKMKIVYSGRGFHIHVFDEDAYKLTMRYRNKLANGLVKRYAIDEWVTAGEMRLIRLPYSLHGMVSRICVPVKKDELIYFDPRTDKVCMPKFFTY